MNALVVDVHGVSIAATLPRWERALRPLLERFSPTREAPSLVVTVREAAVRAVRPFDATWRPSFFFGVMQGFVRADGLAYGLEDGWSKTVVDLSRSSIDAAVFLREDGAPPTTSGMLHASLCLALRERSLFELHAAAVAHEEHGARLIVGHSGAGKTSLALALLSVGCAYLGDDRVLLRGDENAHTKVMLGAYPRTFHVPVASAAAFPSVLAASRATEGIGGKLSFDPEAAFRDAFRSQWRGPVSILLPRVARADRSVIVEASPSDALGALFESSALALVDGVRHRDDNLALLAAIANGATAFHVALGRDALDDPASCARRILRETRAKR
jgi:hypothetical protein